jgi:hypothetical protein
MTPDEQLGRLAAAMMRGPETGQAPAPSGTPAQPEDRTWRNIAAAGELALMALPATRLGRALFATLPRAAATGGGVVAGSEVAQHLAQPAEAQSRRRGDGDPAVMDLQKMLKREGLYDGPIDGHIDPGGPTYKAKQRYDDMQARDAANALAKAKNEADLAAAKAKEEAAKAAKAETDRLAKKAADDAANRAKMDARLKEMESGWGSYLSEKALQYGPIAGILGGGVIGHRLQRALTGSGRAAAQRAADQADAIMAKPIGNTAVSDRIGRVNRFWSEGDPNRVEPFRVAPRSGNPYGYVPNQGVAPAGELYTRTPRIEQARQWGGIPALGGVEHVSTEFFGNQPAKRALAEAEKAYRENPNEATLSALMQARGVAAAAAAVSRLGWGIGGGSLGANLAHGRGARPRPAMIQQAEGERGRLVRLLTNPPKPRKKKP